MNGWYYDEQLFDPLTSITLHPNQKPEIKTINGSNHLVWRDFTKSESDDEKYWKEGEGDDPVTAGGYSLIPIARSIMTEDFNVALSNQWSPVNGDDMISGLWQQGRTIAPYLPIIDLGLDTAEEAIKEAQENKNEENKVSNKITNILDFVVGGMKVGTKAIKEHINDHLVTQGTRFTYYSGTGTAFGNLSMKFTLFPEYRYYNKTATTSRNFLDLNNGNSFLTFRSVQDQVSDLLPYINGDYDTDNPLEIVRLALKAYQKIKKDTSEDIDKKFKELNEKLKSKEGLIYEKVGEGGEKVRTVMKKFNEWVQKVTDGAISIANDVMDEIEKRKLIGWQHPPGGYKPLYKDIDSVLQGTLKLKIGGAYTLSSLLCQDASFNFSKIMVKNIGGNGGLSPLYCDVILNFIPATKFANKSLEDFIRGSRIKYVGGTELGPKYDNNVRGDGTLNTEETGVQTLRVSSRLNREKDILKEKYPNAQAGEQVTTLYQLRENVLKLEYAREEKKEARILAELDKAANGNLELMAKNREFMKYRKMDINVNIN